MKKVLLVNSHPVTGKRLQGYLTDNLPSSYNCELLTAEEMKMIRPDLLPMVIVIDTAAENSNWKIFCRQIHQKHPASCIILITNRNIHLLNNENSENYIHAILDKTFDLDELCHLISTCN